MSLFYLKNEPNVSVVAPTDGTVLPFEEYEYESEKEEIRLSVSSLTVNAPMNGTLSKISTELSECTLVGDTGEIITLKLISETVSVYTAHSEGNKLKMGETIFSIIESTSEHVPRILSLTLDNSEEFRAITVFEGNCISAQTEIMSFCK